MCRRITSQGVVASKGKTPGVLAHLMDGDDVGMVDGGGQAGFSGEAVQVLGVAGHVGMEDLEGNVSAQLAILSAVDSGEAARAYGLQDVISSNSLSCHPLLTTIIPEILLGS